MSESWDLFDLKKAPRAEKPLLESEIQERCVAHARRRHWYARKFRSPANNDVPDYLFGKQNRVIFVEFKRHGKKPTETQEKEHDKIREAGLEVWVCDDVEVFKEKLGRVELELNGQADWLRS